MSRSQKGQAPLTRIRSREAGDCSLKIIREKLHEKLSPDTIRPQLSQALLHLILHPSSFGLLVGVLFPMATSHVTARSILSVFLPRLSAPAALNASRFATIFSRQLSLPVLPLTLAIPSAIQLNVPGIIAGIWESILRAVPKKKTSHMKKRHRQMAGKALKDVTALNKCSACGHVKRAHLLCPYCVKGAFLREVHEPS